MTRRIRRQFAAGTAAPSPVAERVVAQLLSLPIGAPRSDAGIDRIGREIDAYFEPG